MRWFGTMDGQIGVVLKGGGPPLYTINQKMAKIRVVHKWVFANHTNRVKINRGGVKPWIFQILPRIGGRIACGTTNH